MRTELIIPKPIYDDLRSHLLPRNQENEEAAFIFATVLQSHDRIAFNFKELYKAKPQDFAFQSAYHFEFTDEVRGMVIKKAHDLNASIIEFHSHIDSEFIQFSPTDLSGFSDFGPHVLWRLKHKPYCAVVFTTQGFDALVWVDNVDEPLPLDGVKIDDKCLKPSKETLKQMDKYGYRGKIQ